MKRTPDVEALTAQFLAITKTIGNLMILAANLKARADRSADLRAYVELASVNNTITEMIGTLNDLKQRIQDLNTHGAPSNDRHD